MLTQFRVVLHYLSLTVWPLPSRLCITHNFPISHSLFDPITTLFSLLALLGLLAFAVLTARRYRIVSFAILWVYLHLAIESSVIPLELVYEHRMYLPMVGISLLTAWGLFTLMPEGRRSMIVTALLVLSLTMATHFRNSVWQDSQTLWAAVVAKYPEDARAHNNLGKALGGQGKTEGAIEQFHRALRIKPDFPEAHYNLGNALQRQGRTEGAIEQFHRALRIKPNYAEAHNNLGNVLQSQGRTEGAIEQFHRALRGSSRITRRRTTTWAMPCKGKGRSKEPSSIIIEPYRSSRITRRRTTTWVLPCKGKGRSKKPSSNSIEPCGSSLITRRHTITWAMPCKGKGRSKEPSSIIIEPCRSSLI